MREVSISPDEIDDLLDRARQLRDINRQSAIVSVEMSAPPGYVYMAIVDYVESYPDMVLLVDDKRIYFKAIYEK
jgi:hypothetical protein